MLELPPSHLEYSLPTTKAPLSTDEDLYKEAVRYKEMFAQGFELGSLPKIVVGLYDFLVQNQSLSIQEIQEKIVIVLNHFIDITDTPYLPDEHTDPIFKALTPSLVHLFTYVLGGLFTSIPSPDVKPSAKTLSEFIEKMKESFADGFQMHDITTCLRASIDFSSSFVFLKKEERKKCVFTIIDSFIDAAPTGGPDFIVHPVIKKIVHPFVEAIFDKLP